MNEPKTSGNRPNTSDPLQNPILREVKGPASILTHDTNDYHGIKVPISSTLPDEKVGELLDTLVACVRASSGIHIPRTAQHLDEDSINLEFKPKDMPLIEASLKTINAAITKQHEQRAQGGMKK